MNLYIKNVERIWVDVPYRPVPKRNMIRELPHWTIFELCKVTLAGGVVGIGETMPFYTWGEVTDESVRRVMDRPATEMMWDDSLGAGLQMALFDAVGKVLEAPVHQLLGEKVRDEAPISWWSIDLPPEDWLSECKESLRQGYTSYKFKARPWFDLDEQLRVVTAEVPDHFEIDLDFNALCNDSAHAVRLLCELEKYKHVKIYESPIPQGDVEGNKYLRSQTNIPLAMHVGNPPLMTALKENICDGFVLNGGASQLLHEGHILAEANKVFWLQLVGTGLTTAWMAHFGAVQSHARWPAISCVNLYEHMLLQNPIRVQGGQMPVPDGPGLGIEVDWDAVERFRIERIEKPYPHPNLLMRVTWPSGAMDYYTHGLQTYIDFYNGHKPVFSPQVKLEVVPDDGSDVWRRLRDEADKKPAWVMRPI